LGRGYEVKEVNNGWFNWYTKRAVPTWELGGTANAAFRSSLFLDPHIGLMEETLGPGMPSGVGEDTYLFYKILKSGHTIIYKPEAYIHHKHRQSMRALHKQIFNYSKGHVAYHLTTLLKDGDLRVLLQLSLWLPLGHFWRIFQRLRKKSSYTLLLLAIEIAGNFAGPAALLLSYLRVQSEGRSGVFRSNKPSSALIPMGLNSARDTRNQHSDATNISGSIE
jgi:cellulose synthase/poly-beta-1,6-N-acetylglucosamine synthase-like glycosyltransferase